MVDITPFTRGPAFSSGDSGNAADTVDAAAIAPTRSRPFLERAALTAAGVGIDLVDSVSASLNLSDRDEITKNLTEDLPNLGRFIEENSGAIEAGSGIASVVLAVLPQGRIIRGAGSAAKLLRGTAIGNTVRRAALAEKLAFRAARQETASAIAAGFGSSSARAALTAKFTDATGKLVDVQAASKKVKSVARLKGAGEALIGEATLFAIAGENSFLFATAEEGAGTGALVQDLAFSALGLGIGAGIRSIQAGRRLKLLTLSEDVKRAHAGAMDVTGLQRFLEGDLLKATEADKLAADLPPVTSNGAISDAIAAQLIMAREGLQAGIERGGPNRAFSEAAAIQNQRAVFGRPAANEAAEITPPDTTAGLLNRLTRRGASFIPDSAFTRTSPETENLRLAFSKDPTLPLGMEEVSRFSFEGPEIRRQGIINRIVEITQTLDDPKALAKSKISQVDLERELRDLRFKETQFATVIRRGEEIPFYDFAEAAARFDRAELEPFTGKVNQIRVTDELTSFRDDTFGFEMDVEGNFAFPDGVNMVTMTPRQSQAMFLVGRRVIDKVVNSQDVKFLLPSQPQFFQLDMAEEIIRRTGDASKVRFPLGMSRESAMVESLAQKVELFRKFKRAGDSIDFLDREILNLPRVRSFERGADGLDDGPIELLMKAKPTAKAVRETPLTEIQKILAGASNAQDLIRVEPSTINVLGDSFSVGLSDIGRPINEVLVFRRPMGEVLFRHENLLDRFRQANAAVNEILVRTAPDSSVSTFVRQLSDSKIAQQAGRTADLMDVQTRSVFGTSRVQNRAFVSVDRISEDIPTLRAIQAVSNDARRFFAGKFLELTKQVAGGAKRSVDDTFKELRLSTNAGESVRVNQFISARRAWDLTDASPVQSGDTVTFLLDQKSARNKDRWQRLFGEAMPKNAVMRDLSTGRVVEVGADLGMDAVRSLDLLSQSYRNEVNILLKAVGLKEIPRQAFHVPPRDFSGQEVAFIQDATGRVLATLAAPTKEQLDAGIRRLQSTSDSLLSRPGHTVRTQTQLEQFNSLWQRAQTGLLDPSLPVVQLGNTTGRRGGAVAPAVELDAWQRSLAKSEKNFQSLSRDVIEVVYRNQLAGARARSAAIGEPTVRNIHDIYLETALGIQAIDSGKSIVGRGYRYAEEVANLILARGAKINSEINPFANDAAGKREFRRIVDQIGEEGVFFKDTFDFLEQRQLARVPPSVRSVTAKLNRVLASLILRFDAIHPIMNMAGVVNTMPSVLRSMTMRPGETVQAFRNRQGGLAQIFELADGTAVGTLDMTKVVQRALHNGFSKNAAKELDFARSRGYLGQEVAEFQKSMVFLEASASKFDEFTAGLDKTLGFLSDKSEDLSRMWSHMVGLEVANINGITSQIDRHLFAHEFANRVVANYNPFNRLEIFQGGVGANFGLFQSYAFNYMERMFRFIEVGDIRNLATQTGMQALLFGASSVAGFGLYQGIMQQTTKQERNPFDVAQERFGDSGRDVLMHGVLSSFPKLFGDSTGIDLSGRGSAEPVIPGSRLPPFAELGKRTFQFISDGIDQFRAGSPGLSAEQLAEALARASMNRPLAGILDTMTSDGSLDANGRLVTRDSKSALDAAFRLMGARPLQETGERLAFDQLRKRNLQEAAARARLRKAFRSIVRRDSLTPDKLESVLKQYIRSGGDPASFPRFFKETVIAAKLTRNEAEFLKVADDLNRAGDAMRLLESMLPLEHQLEADLQAQDQSP